MNNKKQNEAGKRAQSINRRNAAPDLVHNLIGRLSKFDRLRKKERNIRRRIRKTHVCLEWLLHKYCIYHSAQW